MVGYFLKENSAGNVLEKNTAVGNTLEGYTIKNSSGNMLTENTSIGIGADTEEVAIGFLIIIYAHDNILKRNIARNHRIGFSINFSNDNTLEKNKGIENGLASKPASPRATFW